MDTPALCRDCLAVFDGAGRCPSCRSPRTRSHPELANLAIAHLDCDAFFAAVEKRDDPSLADKPLIIGGGSNRGVVSTACYIARIRGVKSAMPMFKARKLCPDAVILRPRMARYVEVSRQIRAMMEELTPLVEPLSVDEAFLDLTGTTRLAGAPPAIQMARLQARIEAELGLTVSVGLSHNKFLAKIASDLDKPRGFALIGRAETESFLADKPIGLIWGVGAAAVRSLAAEGIVTIGDVQRRDRAAMLRTFGTQGDRLWHLARGIDTRAVSADRTTKSISNETTFASDLSDPDELNRILWSLCEQVSGRAKRAGTSGHTVTLKLKRADHRILTRQRRVEAPVQLADSLFRTGTNLLQRDMDKAPFRLIGIGLSSLVQAPETALNADLLEPGREKHHAAERARDRIRARFGDDAIILGRSFR